MLSFLLFAGALHVNINDLARQRWIILALAVGEIAGLFALEALGGVVYGLALGFIASRLMNACADGASPDGEFANY